MPLTFRVLAATLLLGAASPLAGQSPAVRPPQSATLLRGLQRLDVLVTVAPECGVTDDALVGDSRLALRRTGIEVSDTASAFLAIDVKCATSPPENTVKTPVAIAVHALVVELVSVPRLNKQTPDIGAAIWQHGAAYLSDGPNVRRQIRAGIAAAVDRLERDWRTANPARRP